MFPTLHAQFSFLYVLRPNNQPTTNHVPRKSFIIAISNTQCEQICINNVNVYLRVSSGEYVFERKWSQPI
jgi:hypothetical protein